MGRLVNTSDIHNINQLSKDEYGRLNYIMEKYVDEVVVKAPTVYVNDLIISELEKTKAEIYKEINKDYNLDDIYRRGINQGLYEATTIIDNHIAELKGENK